MFIQVTSVTGDPITLFVDKIAAITDTSAPQPGTEAGTHKYKTVILVQGVAMAVTETFAEVMAKIAEVRGS